jgi:site-specific DNA recombinase
MSSLRIRRARIRSTRLDEQYRSQADLAAQRRELLLLITRLENFAVRIEDGLQHADSNIKRDLARALVRRVESGPDGVNVVFRVDRKSVISSARADYAGLYTATNHGR